MKARQRRPRPGPTAGVDRGKRAADKWPQGSLGGVPEDVKAHRLPDWLSNAIVRGEEPVRFIRGSQRRKKLDVPGRYLSSQLRLDVRLDRAQVRPNRCSSTNLQEQIEAVTNDRVVKCLVVVASEKCARDARFRKRHQVLDDASAVLPTVHVIAEEDQLIDTPRRRLDQGADLLQLSVNIADDAYR